MSQPITTMVFPANSGRAATCSAAQTFDPEEMPTRMPSSRARRRAVAIEFVERRLDHFAVNLRVEHGGTNPGANPCSLCGPGWPPDSTGEASGSTATILMPGLRPLSTSPTPVIVPPVPTPATTMSTFPSVSRQISSAVVFRWISGLDGFANCWRMTLFGNLPLQFLGLCDRALHAFRPFREDEARAEHLEQLAALHAHRLGHGEEDPKAAGGRHERQRDAGVAAVGSIRTVSGAQPPVR